MQISPVYGDTPVLTIDAVTDPSAQIERQIRRLQARLESLDDAQWNHQSRCEAWSTKGVILHLANALGFWGISINAGLQGKPTRFLASFDPVASPAEMVAKEGDVSAADALARFSGAADALLAAIDSIAPNQWTTVVAEAPPGHIALVGVVLHALWDSWIHERDIAIPLGLTPVEEPDETGLILRYVAGLAPAFAVTTGSLRSGALAISATEPSLQLVVKVDGTVHVIDGTARDVPRLEGRTVDLIEGLSFRRPLAHNLDPADRWLLDGLGAVFDQV